jgi:hypothetical protein
MAALDTFEWIIEQFLSNPDAETSKLINSQRGYLLTIRSEDERQRYLEVLVNQIRDLKKKKNTG